MAQRQGFVRVDSTVVQGEGSFVLVRKVSYAQRQTAARLLATMHGGDLPRSEGEMKASGHVDTAALSGNDALTREMLVGNVVAWDWVDDTGAPLPLPVIEPRVVDLLTDEEVLFIVKAISGNSPESAEKN